ncbi:Znf787, partial [Symbiodinium sp. KB8]
MVLGRRALDVLMSSRSLGDELALYRGRLQRFQEALHIRFVDECICWLVDDSKGPVPNHELRALRITAARRSPCRGREFVMEQALLRPVARNFGRRYCDCRLQREALLDEMTSEPLPLAREDLGKGEVVAGTHACPDCDKSFSSLTDLERHMRTVHLGEKPHACPQCDKCFSRAHHLKQHMRAVHLGEKPHACRECSQLFSRARDLEQHMRAVHLGEKPHTCEHCDARFTQANHLKAHIECYHTERGQQRQKKREETVARFLTQSSYSFEREARVEFCSARDAPCPGESRSVNTSLARLDFVLYRPWGVCVIEVDESQHDHMPQACETARML